MERRFTHTHSPKAPLQAAPMIAMMTASSTSRKPLQKSSSKLRNVERKLSQITARRGGLRRAAGMDSGIRTQIATHMGRATRPCADMQKR